MKTLLVIASLIVVAFAAPWEETRINGENGWFVPKVDGSFEWMDAGTAEMNLEMLEGRLLSTNKVKFYLYTKSNPDTPHEITASKKSIDASPFDPNNPVKFTIHGWTSNYKDGVNSGVRRAWFSHGDYNMIAVDWARARSVEYASSVAAVPGAGKKIAAMIDFMHQTYDISLNDFEVIGHSLGAHVAGFTGKNVEDGKIHTIIGLDPALPLYSYSKPEKRLSSTDAFYVESIQTNGGKLGFLKPIGRGAFYPNGGKSQPGCGIDLGGGCAHGRSVTYYVEAVEKNDFPTMKCADYEDAVKKDCGATYSTVRMGAISNAYMVTGDYYVPVNSDSPFGMGA